MVYRLVDSQRQNSWWDGEKGREGGTYLPLRRLGVGSRHRKDIGKLRWITKGLHVRQCVARATGIGWPRSASYAYVTGFIR